MFTKTKMILDENLKLSNETHKLGCCMHRDGPKKSQYDTKTINMPLVPLAHLHSRFFHDYQTPVQNIGKDM